jgi:L-fucose/D-arabinose isomerase
MSRVKNMSTVPAVNRLQGDLPKIGIRPTIDGRRRGVRESLEGQTMAMARGVSDLISKSVRHPCGLPVECVIADTCIGGVAEAARAAEKFRRQGVGATITVTPCWCYGAETMDMDPLTPKAVWGFNGTERPGAVYLASVLASHAQKGLPAFGIYGRDVKDLGDETIPADVAEKLMQFARSALAVATMRGSSYLAIGGMSMGIGGSIVDPRFLESWLGMRYESVDSTEILRRIDEKIYDPTEYERALAWTRESCRDGRDRNAEKDQRSKTQKEADWEFVVKMAIIARDLMVGNPRLAELGFGEEALGHNAIAAGFQGQRQWTDHFPNGDFMETMLNSSFDWNGIRQPFVMATENDHCNAIAMLFGHLLTGTAQIFADVRTYWSPEAALRVTGRKISGLAEGGFIHLSNSGSACLDGTGRMSRDGKPVMKPFWDIGADEPGKCLESSLFCPSNTGYFRGGGYSAEYETRGGMPVTMTRVDLVQGLGPVLRIAEGYAAELPPEAARKIIDRTDPAWPTTFFAPRVTGSGAFRDVYAVMNNWGANHSSVCFGHVGSDFMTLASMLRVPVAMHNVPAEKIFRPKHWAAFGDMESEGADYRACAALGPVYGK